ncbi:hypothetical protein CRI93_08740 [Longimonas halophila]|uniref:DUF2973 domain-containing protein n=1 Tax=Longimonas halophila TaxID=1469170 RepID=A0A2H3P0C0_9BACT|nr:hypothetical protein [Longimonas halophila]PEN06716.1 hypothetical protein CRI93_08740 [Longimonas halophila]
MEYIITALIVYFVLQVVANLVRIWRGYNGQHPSNDFFGMPRNDREPEDRLARKDRESPRFWGRDVEDVSWTDVSVDDEPVDSEEQTPVS